MSLVVVVVVVVVVVMVLVVLLVLLLVMLLLLNREDCFCCTGFCLRIRVRLMSTTAGNCSQCYRCLIDEQLSSHSIRSYLVRTSFSLKKSLHPGLWHVLSRKVVELVTDLTARSHRPAENLVRDMALNRF